jgi:hypothetical protein
VPMLLQVRPDPEPVALTGGQQLLAIPI